MKKIILIVILLAIPITIYCQRERNKVKYVPQVREEIDITIIPGWDLRQIAADWKKRGIIKDEEELYKVAGKPAYDYAGFNKKAPTLNFNDSYAKDIFPLLNTRPKYVSYEGYFFPDTYRIYKDSELHEIFSKIFANLEKKITQDMRLAMNEKKRNLFQTLTMASLVEREAQTAYDMAMVADIFWRRHQSDWALQSCASVNYVTKKNVPYVSEEDKKIDSPYNTYKYSGLPLGPVSNPSLTAIKAAIYPEKNNYWYFMTGNDGKMHYAATLEEQTRNIQLYLR